LSNSTGQISIPKSTESIYNENVDPQLYGSYTGYMRRSAVGSSSTSNTDSGTRSGVGIMCSARVNNDAMTTRGCSKKK
jgi:hypothetical protein